MHKLTTGMAASQHTLCKHGEQSRLTAQWGLQLAVPQVRRRVTDLCQGASTAGHALGDVQVLVYGLQVVVRHLRSTTSFDTLQCMLSATYAVVPCNVLNATQRHHRHQSRTSLKSVMARTLKACMR